MPEQPTAKKIETCRLTGAELAPVFDLGTLSVSDFVEPGTEGIPAPLCVSVAKEAPYLAQLTHSYPPEQMYRRYHYRSGTNEAMRAELADVVAKAGRLRPVRCGEVVCDIASNDGELLRNWPTNVWTIGIDPSDVAREAHLATGGYDLLNDFFSAAGYAALTDKKASVVTCVAMFYDIDDPVGFLKDVRAVLADDGLFVLQVAYTPMHVRMGAWDGICHEHVTYWDFKSLSMALFLADFTVADAEITASNGGSIRVYAMPRAAGKRFSQTVEGAAGDERCRLLREHEDTLPGCGRRPRYIAAYDSDTLCYAWRCLEYKARKDRQALTTFLRQCKDDKKTVAGYAASTKANTLLQFCGIGPDLLPCIADRQEQKWGLCTVGTGIPIVSEAEVRSMKPDYLLCLAWQFTDQFRIREADLIAGGTRLVVPLPRLTVL